MSKKAFVILITLLIIAFGAAYWFLFREEARGPNAGENSANNIFPFGEGQPSTAPEQQGNEGQAPATVDLSNTSQEETPRLRRLSNVPAAGVIAFDRATTTVMRYIERATGHIFESTSASPSSVKLSTITIPKVHEALWASDGQRLLIRYLKEDGQTIRTFYAKISTTTRPEQALEGMFLADGIRDVVSAGNKMFSMEYTASGARGFISNLDGSAKLALFNSAHTDWGIAPSASASRATVYSRPSAQSMGAAYSLNLANGDYSLIANDVLGLTALVSPDGSLAIASGIAGTNLRTVAYDLKTGAPTTLAVTTLTDKCVWSTREKQVVYCAVPQRIPSGSYPDDWYKGKSAFNDSLWKLNVVTGETDNIMTPELDAAISMDMFKLSLDQDEETLVFLNKNDMTAWAYRLKE